MNTKKNVRPHCFVHPILGFRPSPRLYSQHLHKYNTCHTHCATAAIFTPVVKPHARLGHRAIPGWWWWWWWWWICQGCHFPITPSWCVVTGQQQQCYITRPASLPTPIRGNQSKEQNSLSHGLRRMGGDGDGCYGWRRRCGCLLSLVVVMLSLGGLVGGADGVLVLRGYLRQQTSQ